MPVLHELLESVASGRILTDEEALALAAGPRADLFDTAEAVTRRCAPRVFNLCGIVNAKSGRCSENCTWCAQSRHWQVPGVKVYPVVGDDVVERGAKRAEAMGVTRYSLVTSGRKPSAHEVRELCERIRALKAAHPELEVCVSLGLLSRKDLAALKDAGVVRIHCNLETSREFFPQVCTSHTIDEKIETLTASKELGIDVCSGALFGMGETLLDRIRLARLLRGLEVPSIPVNVLHPAPGTPLAEQPKMPEEDFLVAVALLRLMNPTAYLRFAGGRLQLSDRAVREAARIGMNSAISGDFLTTCGASPLDDVRLFMEAGYEPDDKARAALEREAAAPQVATSAPRVVAIHPRVCGAVRESAAV